jgi:hypothetical protein
LNGTRSGQMPDEGMRCEPKDEELTGRPHLPSHSAFPRSSEGAACHGPYHREQACVSQSNPDSWGIGRVAVRESPIPIAGRRRMPLLDAANRACIGVPSGKSSGQRSSVSDMQFLWASLPDSRTIRANSRVRVGGGSQRAISRRSPPSLLARCSAESVARIRASAVRPCSG